MPMERVTIEDDALIVETMSEQEVEDASGFNFDASQQLADDETVEVTGA